MRKNEYFPPALPFYVNDWLSNLKVRSYSHEMRSVYVDMLCLSWKEPDTGLPDNIEALAKQCFSTPFIVAKIFEQNFEKNGERFFNEKLKMLKDELYERHKKRVDAGKKGGEAKPKPSPSIAQAKPKPSLSSSSSSSSSSSFKKTPPTPLFENLKKINEIKKQIKIKEMPSVNYDEMKNAE